MTHEETTSMLLALHNIASALGGIAAALSLMSVVIAIYPWLGGFGSSNNRNIKGELSIANK